MKANKNWAKSFTILHYKAPPTLTCQQDVKLGNETICKIHMKKSRM